jgi:acetolactate synthase-1/2/3 large subunit
MRLLTNLFFLNLITGSDYILDFLESKNIKHIFGYSGGSNLHLLNKINKTSITFIANRHEQFSGHCAEGYAKANNNVGVVFTTSGPGVTNMITPLQDCYSDSIPLLLISGNVPIKSLGTNAFQEVDSTALTKPCTKWNYCLKSVKELPQALENAYNIAMDGKRGPVHLDICSDIFSSHIEYKDTFVKKTILSKENSEQIDDMGKLEKVKNKLINSKKPVFIVGKGAFSIISELRTFVKKFNIPCATTLHAVGIINEHEPISLGMVGMHGTPYANKMIQEADFIIGIGYRFDDRTIGNPLTYGQNAKKRFGIVHVDICKDNISLVQKIINPSISLKMDCKYFMREMHKHLIMEKKDTTDWIKNKKKEYPLYQSDSSKNLKMRDIVHELGIGMKGKDCIVTTGVGNHQMVAAQHFQWNYPQKLLTSGSLGTMGVGLPFAIGAYFACPKKNIICIDGDGSFLMSANELGTISEYNIPIKIILLDNERLQMVHTWQNLFYNKNYISTELKNPKFNLLGKAYGIKTFSCSSKHTMKETLEKITQYEGPVLGHFKVESEHCLPFVKPGCSLDDMLL